MVETHYRNRSEVVFLKNGEVVSSDVFIKHPLCNNERKIWRVLCAGETISIRDTSLGKGMFLMYNEDIDYRIRTISFV